MSVFIYLTEAVDKNIMNDEARIDLKSSLTEKSPVDSVPISKIMSKPVPVVGDIVRSSVDTPVTRQKKGRPQSKVSEKKSSSGGNDRRQQGTASPESTSKKALMDALDGVAMRAKSLSSVAQSLEKKLAHDHDPVIDAQQHQRNAESKADNSRLNDQGLNEQGLNDQVVNDKGILATVGQFALQAVKQPGVFLDHGQQLMHAVLDIHHSQSDLQPARNDHRFRDASWRDNHFYRSTLQLYLAWQQQLEQCIDDLELDEDDRIRSHFILEQLAAAVSPSNWPFNPAAVKRSLRTGGQSRLQGAKQVVDDLLHNGGMPRQTKKDAYKLGKDLATTQGQVVFRDEIFELIQYVPVTPVVSERPVLLIPPQINKYYIFDLSPTNSMVQHLLQQGLQVFVVSWKIPTRVNAEWNLDKYVLQLQQAIRVIRDISNSPDVNVVSACAGGLTAMALHGYFAEAKIPWIHSHSLFVTALQPTNNSIVEKLLTRESLECARAWVKLNGVLEGKQLARFFMWLRPNDLIWNFWVNNYLMGKEPPALDVTFWDSDSTRLPSGLHSDFIDIYLNRVFCQPGRLKVCGLDIDFKAIKSDFFMLGGTEDYLMPWQGCFANRGLVGGECTFVLSDSGHIQSVLRPPGIANIEYFTNDRPSNSAQEWLEGAERHQGSWWELWGAWLQERSGGIKAAPQAVGNKAFPALCPAPGTYVMEVV